MIDTLNLDILFIYAESNRQLLNDRDKLMRQNMFVEKIPLKKNSQLTLPPSSNGEREDVSLSSRGGEIFLENVSRIYGYLVGP